MSENESPLKSRELRVIVNEPSKKKEGSGRRLRVVQYYKDGKNISVKLESGSYWTANDGGERFDRKGLTMADVEALLKTEPEGGLRVIQSVLQLMKNPPAIPAGQDEIEEVPF